MKNRKYEFWFVVGSQSLYGEETLRQVEKNSKTIVTHLNESGLLPWKVVYKDTIKTAEGVNKIIKEANYDNSCAGFITFCHTFSPSKMWINGLSLLQKPYLHFHTQFYDNIPNEKIDMDYMNLHQSAHGDREHGFIGGRMRVPRRIVVGYWKEEETKKEIAGWMRAAVGTIFSKSLKIMRFGDNMREVAVTEGDKIEAQIKLGWQVNTWPVGLLSKTMDKVSENQINELILEYQEKYDFNTDDIDTIKYQAREEIAIETLLQEQGCSGYSNTFEDLYGLEQLPGLASQNLMSKGYGYGGEGDWKVSAMTSIMKAMASGLSGGTSFMEDYTYSMVDGLSLGAHMLEVCPSLAASRPKIEVHDLGIGAKNAPARLVFEGKAGKAILVSLIDMGGRMRLIVQDINCVKPTQTMPNLPVARVMWEATPNLKEGAKAWILAGGSHHTVLSYDLDATVMSDWARIMDIEFVYINKSTDLFKFEQELMWSDIVWKNK